MLLASFILNYAVVYSYLQYSFKEVNLWTVWSQLLLIVVCCVPLAPLMMVALDWIDVSNDYWEDGE